jgi:hypothetical protein
LVIIGATVIVTKALKKNLASGGRDKTYVHSGDEKISRITISCKNEKQMLE